MIQSVHTVGGGFLPAMFAPAVRPPHDRLKLVVTAFGIIFLPLALIGLVSYFTGIKSSIVWDSIVESSFFSFIVILLIIAGVAWFLREPIVGIIQTWLNRKHDASSRIRSR